MPYGYSVSTLRSLAGAQTTSFLYYIKNYFYRTVMTKIRETMARYLSFLIHTAECLTCKGKSKCR